jgi:hypothetical protein
MDIRTGDHYTKAGSKVKGYMFSLICGGQAQKINVYINV